MGRLSLVDPGDVGTSSLARETLAVGRAARGCSVGPNVYRVLTNHPRALRKLLEFGTAVYFDNSMTPAQREPAHLSDDPLSAGGCARPTRRRSCATPSAAPGWRSSTMSPSRTWRRASSGRR